MKLNLTINAGLALRQRRPRWSQFIEMELAGAHDAAPDVLARLAREWSDATTSFVLLVGGPAGRASLIADYGDNRFVAFHKSRRVVAWLRNNVAAFSVEAGALNREVGHA